ncbi:MAG TPA: hypothetical protein PLO53_14600 [Candidatus Hydrogenedentes bacterium]|nr:hypothetical protein [Candidatus Hydrogenedentota bacterium]
MKRYQTWRMIAAPVLLAGVLAQAQENPAGRYAHEQVGGVLGFLLRVSDVILDGWLAFLDWFGSLWAPLLHPVFSPLNRLLSGVYQPWAMIITLAYFIGTMLWVGLVLRPSYVNNGRRQAAWYTDLRLWTVISMLPHLFVYVYFR